MDKLKKLECYKEILTEAKRIQEMQQFQDIQDIQQEEIVTEKVKVLEIPFYGRMLKVG
ncbi:MAG: hypothetical protein R3Y21_04340 [Mycoplasmatota bacterium]